MHAGAARVVLLLQQLGVLTRRVPRAAATCRGAAPAASAPKPTPIARIMTFLNWVGEHPLLQSQSCHPRRFFHPRGFPTNVHKKIFGSSIFFWKFQTLLELPHKLHTSCTSSHSVARPHDCRGLVQHRTQIAQTHYCARILSYSRNHLHGILVMLACSNLR